MRITKEEAEKFIKGAGVTANAIYVFSEQLKKKGFSEETSEAMALQIMLKQMELAEQSRLAEEFYYGMGG